MQTLKLFSGPLPLSLRPTLGIEIAPAAVGCLAVTVLWPELAANIILIEIGIACGPLFAVLTRWHWWYETPFSFGFWSFSFPLAVFHRRLSKLCIKVLGQKQSHYLYC